MNQYEAELTKNEASKKEKSSMAKGLLSPVAAATGWVAKDHFSAKGKSKAAAAALITGALVSGGLGIASAKDMRTSAKANQDLSSDEKSKKYQAMINSHKR